jgi:hypothetical protein
MPWSEDKRETGSALMIIGSILVLFALLAMFFNRWYSSWGNRGSRSSLEF